MVNIKTSPKNCSVTCNVFFFIRESAIDFESALFFLIKKEAFVDILNHNFADFKSSKKVSYSAIKKTKIKTFFFSFLRFFLKSENVFYESLRRSRRRQLLRLLLQLLPCQHDLLQPGVPLPERF